MADRRHANKDWCVGDEKGELYVNIREGAILATLMDIRQELRSLNRVMQCYRVATGFEALSRIDKRLAKKISLQRKRK